MSAVADLIRGLETSWTDTRRLPPELTLRVRTAIDKEPDEERRDAWVEAQSWIVLGLLEDEHWEAALEVGRELASVACHLPAEARELRWLALVRAARVERLAGDPEVGLELLRPIVELAPDQGIDAEDLSSPALIFEAYAERIRLEETLDPSWVHCALLQVVVRRLIAVELQASWIGGELLHEVARRHHRRGDLVSAWTALEAAREAGHRPDPGTKAELAPLHRVKAVEVQAGPQQALHGSALGLLGAIRGRVDAELVQRQARGYLGSMSAAAPSDLAVLVAKVAHRGGSARQIAAPLLWGAHRRLVALGPRRFATPHPTEPDLESEELLRSLLGRCEVRR